MNIIKATIVKGFGTDKVVLTTDLPSACYPYRRQQSISFDTARDTAVEYMRIHFPNVSYDVVERISTVPRYNNKGAS